MRLISVLGIFWLHSVISLICIIPSGVCFCVVWCPLLFIRFIVEVCFEMV